MVSSSSKCKGDLQQQQGTSSQNSRGSMSYPHHPYDAQQTANSPPQPIPCHTSSHHFGMDHSQTPNPHSFPHNATTGQPDEYWYQAQPATQHQIGWNATLPSRPYVVSGNDFSTAQPDPAVGDAIPGAYYSSSIQSASPIYGTPSSQDFGHMGTWNTSGPPFDIEPAQQDPRGRAPIQLNLQNLPGRSERSMSTDVNRPSSPNHDEKKKKKKHSKSGRRHK